MSNKILIVEDNELNMKLFSDLLEAHGYEILRSIDGSDAVELAINHQPNLVLMDIQLPARSGLDLIREIKAHQNGKAIPIVALTAFAMKGDEEKIMASGCDGYVSKPISVPQFLETVDKHISGS